METDQISDQCEVEININMSISELVVFAEINQLKILSLVVTSGICKSEDSKGKIITIRRNENNEWEII